MKTYSGKAGVEYQSITIDFADGDFTEAATTQTFNLAKPSLPGGSHRWMLLAARTYTRTGFTFSDGTAMNLQVGVSGATASIIADAAITAINTELTSVNSILKNSGDTIQALFTVSGGSSPLVSEVTAGKVDIHLVWALEPTALVSNIGA